MKTTASTLLFTVAFLSSICLKPAALAAPGDLDPTFGGTGKVVVGFGGGQARANAAAVQADGKLILAGFRTTHFSLGSEFLITRFDTNNLLDQSFGGGGKVITALTSNDCEVVALAIQADGKILAAGYAYRQTTNSDFALVRYNTNGSLDSSFGTNGNGIVFTTLAQQARINALAIQNDGKIVVDGNVGFPGSGNAGIAVARYLTNGVLDPNFGTGGKIVVPGSEYDALYGLMIQPDQKIVAVGMGGGADFAIYRYTTNGTTDTTFGNGTGRTLKDFGTGFRVAQGTSAAYQFGTGVPSNPDKIVAAGTLYDYDAVPSLKIYQVLIRYGLDGTVDGSFGNSGIATNLTGNGIPAPQGVRVFGTLFEPRQIVVGGSYTDGVSNYFAINRYTINGVLDPTFGANNSGKIILPINPAGGDPYQDAAANGMSFQSNNFILAGYIGASQNGYQFAAARFTTNGSVDTNFSTNGLLVADVADGPSLAHAVAIQTDGKIVVVGQNTYLTNNNQSDRFAIARFNSDGSFDTSFGNKGKITPIFSTGPFDDGSAVTIQPDGKIIAGGSADGGFALARLNANGSLDGSFGTNGLMIAQVGGGSAQINTLQIQPDGKILACGTASTASSPGFALARFHSNGMVDTNFGSAGSVITTFPAAYDVSYGMGLQPDGKIILAGTAISANGTTFTGDFAAARYNTNGSLDFSFGTLGKTTGNVGSSTLDVGYAMAIQPDGKILIAGGAGQGFFPGPVSGNQNVNSFLAVMRFNTNGTPDNTFGTAGGVITQVGTLSDFATSIALQPDGKILVAGASQNGYYKFFALRYTTNGTMDGSYGNGGAALVNFGTATNEIPYGMALDSYGRAVIAGDAGGVFGIARLQGDAIPSPALKIFLTSTNAAVITWPYPSTGWNLRETVNPIGVPWTEPAQTTANDGTNNFIIVSPPLLNHFYRLQSP